MSIAPTNPLYYGNCGQLTCDSQVLAVQEATNYKKPGCNVVILDQTVCYPQGGGQPSDIGEMVKDGGSAFQILDARMDRATNCIQHIGQFSGDPFAVGDQVTVNIDANKRLLYNQLHTAGHVVDACIRTLGYDWRPTKGHHFPEGPFVEYEGEINPSEINEVIQKVEARAQELIASDVPVQIHLDVSREKATELCGGFLDPIYLKAPELRLISIGDLFYCPCGGTHVESCGKLGGIKIPKIKATPNKKMIKVSYKMV